jgi:hypothetical protein
MALNYLQVIVTIAKIRGSPQTRRKASPSARPKTLDRQTCTSLKEQTVEEIAKDECQTNTYPAEAFNNTTDFKLTSS